MYMYLLPQELQEKNEQRIIVVGTQVIQHKSGLK